MTKESFLPRDCCLWYNCYTLAQAHATCLDSESTISIQFLQIFDLICSYSIFKVEINNLERDIHFQEQTTHILNGNLNRYLFVFVAIINTYNQNQ